MAGSGEKLGTDPWIGWTSCCELCQEPFFLGAVTLSIIVDDFAKGYHIRGPPAGSICRAYVDWREKRMCHVGFPPAGCTSIQVIMTLGYE
jgi:hypothetical protein